jgi:hypothetical protein
MTVDLKTHKPVHFTATDLGHHVRAEEICKAAAKPHGHHGHHSAKH